MDVQLDLCRGVCEITFVTRDGRTQPWSASIESPTAAWSRTHWSPLGLNRPLTREDVDGKPSALPKICYSPTMMQTAGYHANHMPQLPVRSSQQPSTESIRASVAQLLSQAHNLSCSKAAQAFSQLLPHISRFQLALDALLPSLDEGNEVCGYFRCSSSRSLPQRRSRRVTGSFRAISCTPCTPPTLYPSTHSQPSYTPFSSGRPTRHSRWRGMGVSQRMTNLSTFFGRSSKVMERM